MPEPPQVFVNGALAGTLDRNAAPNATTLAVPAAALARSQPPVLDILVSAMGRLNFGCGWDVKGLTSPQVTLNGACRTSTPATKTAEKFRHSVSPCILSLVEDFEPACL